jgi:hypothetical protein
VSSQPIEGPVRTVEGPNEITAPFYVIPFDKQGTCIGPRTRDRLVEDAKNATDIFLFSHGWNNTWPTALNRYNEFITAYLAIRAMLPKPPVPGYRPLLAGVFWPSAVLVDSDEQAPVIAAAPEGAAAPDTESLLELTADLPAEQTARLSVLLTKDRLDRDEALEAAGLIARVLGEGDDELGGKAPAAEDLVDNARQLGQSSKQSTSEPVGGFIQDTSDSSPQVAGWKDLLDPRQLIRTATVLMMKDRAGRVGATGVSDTLVRLHAANNGARIHLVGHSYGSKVVLSALCAPAQTDAVTVDSVLLLQAATSCYCFAPAGAIPGAASAGGYHEAPARSAKPVVCTFSRHDAPLTKLFHLTARRSRDLGDPQNAPKDGVPSKYAALGGFGPRGVTSTTIEPVNPIDPYPFPNGSGIVGVHADNVISGHGDVSSQATAWMLLSQVRG